MSSNPVVAESQVSRDELEQARCDLAAVFRIAARENLNEGIDYHFSHALGDGTFLVNRWGSPLIEHQHRKLVIAD